MLDDEGGLWKGEAGSPCAALRQLGWTAQQQGWRWGPGRSPGVTEASLATSNHWDTGTGKFTSYLKDKNKDQKPFLDFKLRAGGTAQTWWLGLLGLLWKSDLNKKQEQSDKSWLKFLHYLTQTSIFFWDHPKLGREWINSDSSRSSSAFNSWVPLCQSAPSTSSYELTYFCKIFQLWPSLLSVNRGEGSLQPALAAVFDSPQDRYWYPFPMFSTTLAKIRVWIKTVLFWTHSIAWNSQNYQSYLSSFPSPSFHEKACSSLKIWEKILSPA